MLNRDTITPIIANGKVTISNIKKCLKSVMNIRINAEVKSVENKNDKLIPKIK